MLILSASRDPVEYSVGVQDYESLAAPVEQNRALGVEGASRRSAVALSSPMTPLAVRPGVRSGVGNDHKPQSRALRGTPMPSTVVHMAFAGMLAAALLGDDFDRRAVLVIFAATALPDLDAFVGLVSTAGHRTVGHTLLLPLALGLLLAADVYVREESFVTGRWGDHGVRVAWMSVVAMAVAGIGLDLFVGGANPFWPLHDQFYRIAGKVELSNQRGIIQTFVDLDPDTERTGVRSFGTSKEVHVSTGVDPTPGPESGGGSGAESESEPVERIFPVVRSGWQLLLLVVGSAVTAVRLRQVER
ncbi:metal-dependent hydrolase [Haloarculaceae archaeon H-GB11]|nr:metal-dependent hydrolase [Haloarculaceae archaeon H-GB11]